MREFTLVWLRSEGLFQGVYPMLPTAFRGDGSVDLDVIQRLVDHGISQGVDGISIMGLAAEVRQLNVEERRSVVEAAIAAIGGRCPTIVGVSADDSPTSCELAAHAEGLGAQLIMVAPPSVLGLGEEDQIRHFIAVAAAAPSTMVMVQDAPNELGVFVGQKTIERVVAAAPNVRYAKLEGANTGQAISDLKATEVGGELNFFGGTGGLHYMDLLDAGALGVMPAYEAPGTFRRITELFRAGDHDAARALHMELMPFLVYKAQSLALSVLAVKEVLRARGVLDSVRCRIAPPLGDWSRRAVLRHAQAAGLLAPVRENA